MIALRMTLAAAALASLSACGATGNTGMSSYVAVPQIYSPTTYSDGVNRAAPVAVAAAPAGQPSAPARVGVTVINPYTGAAVFTTDRQLTLDEQMRLAAEYCRAQGKVLGSANLSQVSASGAPGTNNQVFCQ